MPAELWKLTMENGQVIYVLALNCKGQDDLDAVIYRHVPSQTTIKIREFLVRFEHSPFSVRMSYPEVERFLH